MRILHVETGRHLYGGASQARLLAAGLASAGVESALVCARGGELARAGADGATVLPLRVGGDLDAAAGVRFARAIRALEPDLVHVHSRRGADLFAGLAAGVVGVPAVLTRRVDSAEPAAWLRLKCRPYARIVALSRAIESELRSSGIAAERIVRIPSAVDTRRFRPDPRARERLLAAAALPSDALAVGVIAQLIPRKGHARWLAALPEVVRVEPRTRTLLFGRGPLEAALRAEVRALGLERHVVFAGFRDDLASLLPGLDLLVHPARREGLGAALLEAAGAGVAIVAAPAGGVPDVLEDGSTARLVDFDDRPAVVAAVTRLLADDAERVRLGAAARLSVERRFSVDAMVQAYVRVYESVLGAARVGARGTARHAEHGP